MPLLVLLLLLLLLLALPLVYPWLFAEPLLVLLSVLPGLMVLLLALALSAQVQLVLLLLLQVPPLVLVVLVPVLVLVLLPLLVLLVGQELVQEHGWEFGLVLLSMLGLELVVGELQALVLLVLLLGHRLERCIVV